MNSMTFDAAKLAVNIRKYRLNAGYSQKVLGDFLHVTPQTISKWEKGIAFPDIENFAALAGALHTSPNVLLGVSEENKEKYFIGVDGGGTKTEFILADRAGNIKKRVILGGSNPNVVSIEKALAVLMEGIDICFSEATAVEGIYIGAAGVASGLNTEKMLPRLKKKYWGTEISLKSDIENVILSSGFKKGLATILGTGFIIYAFDEVERFRIGGIGYLFEGGGSGYDLGHDAIRYALQAENGMLEKTYLYYLVTGKLAADFPAAAQRSGAVFDYIDHIYEGGNEYIASFAPLVFNAYKKNDSFSAKILRDNFLNVEKMLRFGLERSGKDSPIVLMGGLSKEKEILTAHFGEDIRSNLFFLDLPPVFGAVIGALEQSDENIFEDPAVREDFKTAFMAQYEEVSRE